MKEGNIEPQVPVGDLKILQEICEAIQIFGQEEVNTFNILHMKKYSSYPIRIYSTLGTKAGTKENTLSLSVHEVFELVNNMPYTSIRALYKMTEGMANQIGIVPPPPNPCPPNCQ